jgi:hypothetical protein
MFELIVGLAAFIYIVDKLLPAAPNEGRETRANRG